MLDLDGSNGGVSFQSPSVLDNVFDGGGTLMAWINPSGWGENGRGRIWDKASGTSPTGGWAWYITNAFGEDFLAFGHNFSFVLGEWGTPVDSIVLNNLHHVVIPYNNDSSANDPLMYINGQSVSIFEFTPPSGTRTSDASQSLILGTDTSIARTFDGLFGDSRVYNRILSAGEIQTIFASRGHDAIVDGLVCRAIMNEGAPGTTVASDGDVKDISQYKHPTLNASGSTMTYVEDPLDFNRRVA